MQRELSLYNESLAAKPAIVVANKIDKVPGKGGTTLAALRRRCGMLVVPVSAIQGPAGLGDLKLHLRQLTETAVKHKPGMAIETDHDESNGMQRTRVSVAA